MNPQYDWIALVSRRGPGRCPNIQIEAIFTRGFFAEIVIVSMRRSRLHTLGRKPIRMKNTPPTTAGLRGRHPKATCRSAADRNPQLAFDTYRQTRPCTPP